MTTRNNVFLKAERIRGELKELFESATQQDERELARCVREAMRAFGSNYSQARDR